MPESVVYNCNCLDYLKTLPDNAFELAVVDPPYGGGFTEGGGCKGWFSKYHQNNDDRSQNVQVEREREIAKGSDATEETDGTDTIRTSCGNGSTGTTLRFHGGGKKDPWKKYLELHESRNRNGKKLSRGTLRREKIISKSFSASRAIRSSGAETILLCRRPDAF